MPPVYPSRKSKTRGGRWKNLVLDLGAKHKESVKERRHIEGLDAGLAARPHRQVQAQDAAMILLPVLVHVVDDGEPSVGSLWADI